MHPSHLHLSCLLTKELIFFLPLILQYQEDQNAKYKVYGSANEHSILPIDFDLVPDQWSKKESKDISHISISWPYP